MVIPADHPGLNQPCRLNTLHFPIVIPQSCLFCDPTTSKLSAILWDSKKETDSLSWYLSCFNCLHFRESQLTQLLFCLCTSPSQIGIPFMTTCTASLYEAVSSPTILCYHVISKLLLSLSTLWHLFLHAGRWSLQSSSQLLRRNREPVIINI